MYRFSINVFQIYSEYVFESEVQMQIYNVAINPELAQMSLGSLKVQATRHAELRAIERAIKLPIILNISAGSIVELEAQGKQIKKIVARFARPNSNIDEVYVLVPHFGTLWTILTCYTNSRDDQHSTLNLNRLGV